MKCGKQKSFGQAVWSLASDTVTLVLTQQGGHMAPVVFFKHSRSPVEPYYVSPWQGESSVPDEPVLRPLRGDFFCCPFGGNPAWRGETHRAHGEPAYAKWGEPSVTHDKGLHQLQVSMRTSVRKGKVTKRVGLRDGENVVYVQHTLEGFSGRMPMGHHATLRAPSKGHLRISASPVRFGMTSPRSTMYTTAGEYYALAPVARFKRLDRVPTIWQEEPYADCSVFPAREGFVDIIGVFARDTSKPAWTCAVAADAGYVWFALKDPAVLPATVMWMENRGRHGAPWSGRNVCIGLEEVCAYFAEGLKASVQRNALNEAGIPTAIALNPRRSTTINYVQGVARVPRTFDRVRRVRFGNDAITLVADSGDEVSVSVRHAFLRDGRLQ